MATADQLLELIFCWIKEKERFADNLRKLAEELESLRKKCNVGEYVGSSLTVLGALGMIGAGAVTFFTGEAAAPLMVLASACTGIGSAISVGTKIIEHFCSSTTMKEMQNIEKKSNEIAKEIQQLFQKLKSEKKEVNPLAEPDELEHHIMAEFLRAIARQCGLNDQIINDSVLNDTLIRTLHMISDMDSRGAGGVLHQQGRDDDQRGTLEIGRAFMGLWGGGSSAGAGRRSEGHFGDWMDIPDTKSTPRTKQLNSILCVGVLSVVLIIITGHNGKTQLSNKILQLLTNGFQTVLQGVGGLVVGGLGVGGLGVCMMTRALSEMIKGNHVTEASQSLRDTDYEIQETTRTLKEQIKKIKKNLQETEKEKQTSQETEKEKQKSQETEEKKQKSQETEKEKQKSQEIEETEEEESSENEDPPAVKVGLLNVRSIKNMTEKRLKIKDLITDNNLDVFLLTETWLENETADEALRETALPNFWFETQCRDSRGGGVAILFSQALQGLSLIHSIVSLSDLVHFHLSFYFQPITTFEYVATALRHDEWDEDVLFINVYRPPTQTQEQFNDFVDEFQMLLNMASTRYNSIIVAGDFNVHVEEINNRGVFMFETVSVLRDFVQHVQEPTHQNGGILDLVFSRNVEVAIDNIRDDGISDHFTVYFSIRPKSKDAKTKENPLKKEE